MPAPAIAAELALPFVDLVRKHRLEVMLPLSLLVGAGALWTTVFPDTDAEAMRSQLNRLVLYLFFPCILFAVGASTRITTELLAVPLLVGIEMTPFMAACVTFSIQSSAFFAEVFRAGIASVERGQWDGARAIGMTYAQAMHRIVLPQAVKRMIPAFLERAIELMKTTTLVATIAYADLLYAANEISQKTFRPLETFTVAALIYFVVITAFSVIARRFERRLAVSGEATVH